MAIKEKKLKDFLERLAHSSGASGLAQEVEGLFKKDEKPVETPEEKAPVPTPVKVETTTEKETDDASES